MDKESKLRLLYLKKILCEYTDDDHYLTTAQLCTMLKEQYGIDAHRTTIKSDIEVLGLAGVDIQEIRSTQNQYNYIGHTFEVAELKLLIDAVLSAKFMTKEKSDVLVEKLTSLAGKNKACELKRNLAVDGRYKTENDHILIIIDRINEAINNQKKIMFQKFEFNAKKEHKLHNDGEWYTFSPYSLVWDGDYYYVVGYSDKHGSVGSHRVDRFESIPLILEEAIFPVPSDFDINKYINTTFRMYNAPRKIVELICDNSLMTAIMDRFGPDVETYACDQHNFRVIAEIAIGTVFFNWISGFEGRVRIKSPEDVKQQYKEHIHKADELA